MCLNLIFYLTKWFYIIQTVLKTVWEIFIFMFMVLINWFQIIHQKKVSREYCEAYIAIFASRVTFNYAHSPFNFCTMYVLCICTALYQWTVLCTCSTWTALFYLSKSLTCPTVENIIINEHTWKIKWKLL